MSTGARAAGQPDWADLIDALIEAHGGLSKVAERLAAERGHVDNLGTIERALRRLRARGGLSGGQWGARLLRTFGLPLTIEERLRFMGAYHSRFVDLPVPLCADLVAMWDRPPANESRVGRLWLGLARLNLAFRERDLSEAARILERLAPLASADAAGHVEYLLGGAYVASYARPGLLPPELAEAATVVAELAGEDALNLRARIAGQVAWVLNMAGEHAEAEARMTALPDGPSVPPFARARRANGLAYVRHRLGDTDGATAMARRSSRYAGDAGHVRLRAMALLMLARVTSDERERAEARERARAIARALADPGLLARVG